MEIYKNIIDELFEGAYIVDESRKILFWNKQAERITGYTQDEVMGHYCYDNILRHVDDFGCQLCDNGCPLFETLQSQKMNSAKVYLHHREGHRVPVQIKSFFFIDPSTQEKRAIEIFTDSLDERIINQEYKQLRKAVTIDNLTGLFNRQFIDYQLDLCITENRTFETTFGILFIDIDHFKAINDTYGHQVGDKVLKIISKTLRANVRMEDYVGRWGGEEFIIILRNNHRLDLLNIAEKLRKLVENTKIAEENQFIQVTISIGGSNYKDNLSKEKLIEIVDKNMYEAKKIGRNKTIIT